MMTKKRIFKKTKEELEQERRSKLIRRLGYIPVIGVLVNLYAIGELDGDIGFILGNGLYQAVCVSLLFALIVL